jgi:hypothetical protein
MIEVQDQQQLGRAMNAVQEFLVHKLLFPKVYIDADWNGKKVDVLAIDRSGSGDVHAVRMVYRGPGRYIEDGVMVELARKVHDSVIDFKSYQSHFRYVAVVNDEPDTRVFKQGDETTFETLAKDGVGRIGILYVDLTEEDPKFQVRVILRAERFRNSKELVEMADQFVASHTANWEFREEL